MKKINFKKIGEKFFLIYLYFALTWVVVALGIQTFFVYLHFSGQEERASKISNEITWKIDGRFKDNPDNIWYEPKKQ
jgi:hypothetical protein